MIGAPRRYDGPMGKSDRAFAFGLLALVLVLAPVLGISEKRLDNMCLVLLLLVCALLLRTIVNRIKNGVCEAP